MDDKNSAFLWDRKGSFTLTLWTRLVSGVQFLEFQGRRVNLSIFTKLQQGIHLFTLDIGERENILLKWRHTVPLKMNHGESGRVTSVERVTSESGCERSPKHIIRYWARGHLVFYWASFRPEETQEDWDRAMEPLMKRPPTPQAPSKRDGSASRQVQAAASVAPITPRSEAVATAVNQNTGELDVFSKGEEEGLRPLAEVIHLRPRRG